MGRAAPLSQVFMTSDVQKNDFEAYNGDDELGYINSMKLLTTYGTSLIEKCLVLS